MLPSKWFSPQFINSSWLPVKISIFITILASYSVLGWAIHHILNNKRQSLPSTPAIKLFSLKFFDDCVSIQGWMCF